MIYNIFVLAYRNISDKKSMYTVPTNDRHKTELSHLNTD